jgi:hypothetical protein
LDSGVGGSINENSNIGTATNVPDSNVEDAIDEKDEL